MPKNLVWLVSLVLVTLGTRSVEAVSLINPLPRANSVPALIGWFAQGLLGVIGSAALGVFVWGGLKLILAAGEPKKIQEGKDAMVYAAWGLAAAFSGYAVAKFVLNALEAIKG